jgi:hypothetical protein
VNDRAFRLDFFIAIAALLVSAFTAATLLYQTRVIGDQFAATIWPYLSVGTTYNTNGETIEVANDGLGPALVRSARLTVDGVVVRAWDDYVLVLARDPDLRAIFRHTRAAVVAGRAKGSTLSMSSIGPSSTVRPGESDMLLRIALADDVPTRALTRHSVRIDLCYCSLNGSCWTLSSASGRISADPHPVSACTSAFAIESNPLTAPVPRNPAAAN